LDTFAEKRDISEQFSGRSTEVVLH